tara:strand:+ start:2845 stop:3489 length:645 start_codon:yes stop_codon:yes gene_type:complete
MARPVFNRKGMKVPGMFQAGGNTPKRQQRTPDKSQQERETFNTSALQQAKRDLSKDTANFQRFQQANQFDASMPSNDPRQPGLIDDGTRQQAQSYVEGMKSQQSLIATVEAAMRENIELQRQLQVKQSQDAQQQIINSGRKQTKDHTKSPTPRQMGGGLGKTPFDVINERNRPPSLNEMNASKMNKQMSPADIKAIKEKAESMRRGGFIKMKYN